MGKKPFIDKKAAKHFHVVHRSQKDPLINDTEAPDRVLQEVLPGNLMKVTREEYFIYASISTLFFFFKISSNLKLRSIVSRLSLKS